MSVRRFSSGRLYGALICFVTSLTFLMTMYDDPWYELTLLTATFNNAQHIGEATEAFPENKDVDRDPPPSEPPFAAVVIAGQESTQLDWTLSLEKEYLMFVYNVDNLNNTDQRLQLPGNKGREAMVYLSWIINNYDSLPWAGIFVHGHAESWHQPDPIERLIRGLNVTSLSRVGYISLRCYWDNTCPDEIRPQEHDPNVWGDEVNEKATESAIAGNWVQMFPDEPLPSTIASPCCAQFAVTRRAIQHRPKADYERLRKWLMDSLLPDEFSGRVLEKLWAYIFTGIPVQYVGLICLLVPC